jgi:predicted protein tyrosine phosphatase
VLERVVFMGRGDAEDTPAEPDWVVVSINTPGRGAADLVPGWRAVLHQEFHDLDTEHSDMPIFSHRIFSHDQAREVWDFICSHARHIEGVMVHCHAGIHRSAAIAKALAEHFGAPFPPEYDQHNMLVFRKMLETAPALSAN